MKLLMLGSGPGAVEARNWDRAPFDAVVAINNAWRIRDDWDFLVYPYDFPSENMPPEATGALIDETHFVPAQNAYGGFVFGGATMAFTATYWALHALKPTLIAYLGCDMHYPKTGPTHFYGEGTADPLRADVSLRNLEARSERARVFAARQDCALVNLSSGPSRLLFPRATQDSLPERPAPYDRAQTDRALEEEARLGYQTPTGFHDHLDIDTGALDAIDALWLAKS
ncbi:MAG: hypothetical protein AAFP28_09195 [Pseudomonadota bacterium]